MNKIKTELGELWLGDCLGLMQDIPDGSIDMVLCDLPYGTTGCKWDIIIPFEVLWKEYKRICKDNSPIVLTANQPFTSLLVLSNINGFKHSWVWNKEICGAFALAKKRPMIVTEDICVFGCSKKAVNYYPIMEMAEIKNVRPINKGTSMSEATFISKGMAKSAADYNPLMRYPKNILNFSKYSKECNQLNRVHPTQKPVALMEYLIKTYSIEGQTVLDNCAGSGSTLVACENLNRKWIGIEKEEKYFEIAEKRIENVLK